MRCGDCTFAETYVEFRKVLSKMREWYSVNVRGSIATNMFGMQSVLLDRGLKAEVRECQRVNQL